jgi:hypothetical protein
MALNNTPSLPRESFCPRTGEKFWFFSMDDNGMRRREVCRIKIAPDGQESLFIDKKFVATLPGASSEKERNEHLDAMFHKHDKNRK